MSETQYVVCPQCGRIRPALPGDNNKALMKRGRICGEGPDGRVVFVERPVTTKSGEQRYVSVKGVGCGGLDFGPPLPRERAERCSKMAFDCVQRQQLLWRLGEHGAREYHAEVGISASKVETGRETKSGGTTGKAERTAKRQTKAPRAKARQAGRKARQAGRRR